MKIKMTEDHHHDEDESSTSSSGGEEEGGSCSAGYKDEEEEDPNLLTGNVGTKAVNRSKLLVYVALLIAATVVGVATFKFARNQEERAFRQQFESYAKEVINVAENTALTLFGGLDSLSASLTSHAVSTGSSSNNNDNATITTTTMPFLVLPDFERRTNKVRALARADVIAWIPMLLRATGDDDGGSSSSIVGKWENYSVSHQDWIQQSLDVRRGDGEAADENNGKAGPISEHIHSYKEEEEEESEEDHGHEGHGHRKAKVTEQHEEDEHQHGHHHREEDDEDDGHDHHHSEDDERAKMSDIDNKIAALPLWQISPPPIDAASIVNLDLYSHPSFRRMASLVIANNHVVLSEFATLNFILDYTYHDAHDDDAHPSETLLGHNDNNHDDHGHHEEEHEEEEDADNAEKGQHAAAADAAAPDTHGDHEHHGHRRNLQPDGGHHAGHGHHHGGEETPHSYVLHPVYGDFGDNSNVAGFLLGIIHWDFYFGGVLPDGTSGLAFQMDDSCGSVYTYHIQGNDATFLGEGEASENDQYRKDLNVRHDFAVYSRASSESSSSSGTGGADGRHCNYVFEVYPTEEFRQVYMSGAPAIYTAVAILIFVLTTAVFVLYDLLVQRRQKRVMVTQAKMSGIVTSVFPSAEVRKRVMMEDEEEEEEGSEQDDDDHHHDDGNGSEDDNTSRMSSFTLGGAKNQLKNFLGDEASSEHTKQRKKATHHRFRGKPIADLFPNVTVMFADIVGFTAWSSTREPSQVFVLLETIYSAFDEIARRRRVFKVETVGDCYVAACGIPDARKDHAIALLRFARDCLYKMSTLTRSLEVELGPETADLALRIGLHSGQVTAGVLRGDRARFQLFGDTMNTGSRMESTGERNRVQISQATADLVVAAGKGHWIRPREELVNAKGKGQLQTYWANAALEQEGGSVTTQSLSESLDDDVDSVTFAAAAAEDDDDHQRQQCGGAISDGRNGTSTRNNNNMMAAKRRRLVDWNAAMLKHLLQCIVAKREANSTVPDSEDTLLLLENKMMQQEKMLIDEVQEVIHLPSAFDPRLEGSKKPSKSPEQVELGDPVIGQLQSYVYAVALLYRENAFHNFEHASHVACSTSKLLSRIVASHHMDVEEATAKGENNVLRDRTYGIGSDPLVAFSCVLSSICHDADHPGVPNSTLVRERASLAVAYRNKSVAEQNSLDICFELLMGSEYKDLRRAIYSTREEFYRFRALMINSVMATDIMDRELAAQRKARWNKAFSSAQDPTAAAATTTAAGDGNYCTNTTNNNDRKATIVIEHIIQASDVAHTMQHWHIYQKWNELLFVESWKAFRDGRTDKDPTSDWYEGEIGFFDHYIIPLAKKLESCGVFGVSSDEYLTYAMQNRQEWELKGRQLVEAMKRRYCEEEEEESSPRALACTRKTNLDAQHRDIGTTTTGTCLHEESSSKGDNKSGHQDLVVPTHGLAVVDVDDNTSSSYWA